MRWCVVLTLAVSAAAQTGSISGVVRDADAGTPVGNYLIRAADHAAMTAGDGSYSFDSLQPGPVLLLVNGIAGTAQRYVILSAGQKLTNIDLLVRSYDSRWISGRVLDGNGNPVAGVKVALRRREYRGGVMSYFPNGDAATGEDGKYLLKGLEPGRGYLVEVYPPATGDDKPDTDGADVKSRPLELPHTYYPGTTYVEDALAITLGPVETRTGVDIRIRKAPAYCIDGVIDDAGNTSQIQYTIDLEDSRGGVLRRAASGVSGQDGRFRSCHLFPGTYRVAPASANHSGRGYLGGMAEVVIRDGDVHDVRLAVQPVPPVSFEAVWDTPSGDAGGDLLRFPYEVTSLDESTRSLFAGVAAEGHLGASMPLPAVDFEIRARGLPPGDYLKDFLVSGVSLLRKPVVKGSAVLSGAHIRFVIGRDGGSIAGMAADSSGKAAPQLNVVFVPEDVSTPAELSEAISTTLTDQNGAFRSATLAPGRYRVIATSSPVPPTPECMEKLWAARSSAAGAEVQAGSTAAVKLVPVVLQ